MPRGTRVHRCYEGLKKRYGKERAAAICQSSTGQSLKSGRKINPAKKKDAGNTKTPSRRKPMRVIR